MGEINIDRKSVKDSAAHGLSKSKVQAYYLVPEVLKNGVLLGEMPLQDNKPKASVIAAPVAIGDAQYKMYIEVRHDENMQRMYVHEVVLREDDSTGAFKTSAATHKEAEPQGAPRGALFSFIQNLRDVKSSKVVDENGEPLVVYHGSDEGFDTFLKEKIGSNIVLPNGAPRGFYFAKDKVLAEKYGKTITEAFISGVPLLNNSKIVVAGEPTQIKSAIANNGNFDGTNPNILHQQQFGSFNPETNTIAVFKQGNLSTVLHELGHFFFENNIFLAAELLGKTEQLTDGEHSLVNETSALLSWHGIQGTPQEQIEQWYTMDFEQKRGFHERTAESFEAYLFSGKAPSIELQSAFQTFKRWLLDVYKSITAFISSHPEAGKLNPELRAIFDRMLASK